MDNFENIKQLWNSKSTMDFPNLEQIQIVIKKYQSKKKQNIYLLFALFVLCCIVLILVFTLHKPLLWTTTFGEILISMGFILIVILKLNTLKSITKNELKSNKDFLEDLIKVSVQKKSKVNWFQVISVLLLAIGYGFFIYEEIKENQTELILSYFGIALFTLGMFFVFRPFIKRNSRNRTKRMLETIEKLK